MKKLIEIYKENPYKVKYYSVMCSLLVIALGIFIFVVRYTAKETLSFGYEYNASDSTATTIEERKLVIKW